MITLQVPEKLQPQLYDIDKFLRFENSQIATKEDASKVADVMGDIKDHMNRTEEQRKMVTKPLNDVIKIFNGQARKISDPLNRIYNSLKIRLGKWQLEEKRKADEDARKERQAELERLAMERKEAEALAFKTGSNIAAEEADKAAKREENKAKQPVKTDNVLRTDQSNFAVREDWKFEIKDATKIPREFLMPDTSKIGSYVRKNKQDAKIPGVKTFSVGVPIRR